MRINPIYNMAIEEEKEEDREVQDESPYKRPEAQTPSSSISFSTKGALSMSLSKLNRDKRSFSTHSNGETDDNQLIKSYIIPSKPISKESGIGFDIYPKINPPDDGDDIINSLAMDPNNLNFLNNPMSIEE